MVPEHSQLLLIDPVPQYINQLDSGLASKISKQFQRLSEAAEQTLVPRYFMISQDTDDRDTWLSMPCERNKKRVFQFERNLSVWSNTDMVLSMQKEDREQHRGPILLALTIALQGEQPLYSWGG